MSHTGSDVEAEYSIALVRMRSLLVRELCDHFMSRCLRRARLWDGGNLYRSQ